MTVNPFNHGPRDSRPEENDAVWALLASSPRREPDAWFSVRTLARCRLAGTAEPQGRVLDRVWRWALGSGLVACLMMFVVTRTQHASAHSSVNQKGVQEAFEIMASIRPDADASSAPSSDSSSWQDSSL